MNRTVLQEEVICRHTGITDGRVLANRYRLNRGVTPTQSRNVNSVLNRRKKQVESVEEVWAETPRTVIEMEAEDAPDTSHMDDEYILGLIQTNKVGLCDELTLSQTVYQRACKQLHVTPISHFLVNLTNKDMIMRNYSLSVKDVKACALALSGNTKVETLDLTCDNMCPASLVYITTMIEDNHYISTLRLGHNDLGSDGARVLAKCMATNRSIDVLDISGNKFKETDAIFLKYMLQKNTSLRELDLSYNELREKGAEILAAGIESNKTLEWLDLSWNHVRRKGATAIALALQTNKSLERINLSWNGLYMDGCVALGRALQTNTTLKELDLSCNRIDVECVGVLSQALVKNTTLETLRLANNPLTTPGAVLLLTAICKHADSVLQEIDFGEQPVDKDFIDVLDKLQSARPMLIRHGIVLRQDVMMEDEEDDLINENPMAVLLVFMRMRNMRLLDLFKSLDKDGSRTLTKQEIKQGLLSLDKDGIQTLTKQEITQSLLDLTIPLSDKALDRLINKLDLDNDGEIDFGEMMSGHKGERRKNAIAVHTKDTDAILMKADQTQRIMDRLSELMDKKMRMYMRTLDARKSTHSLLDSIKSSSIRKRSPSPEPVEKSPEEVRRRSIHIMKMLKIVPRKSQMEQFDSDDGRRSAASRVGFLPFDGERDESGNGNTSRNRFRNDDECDGINSDGAHMWKVLQRDLEKRRSNLTGDSIWNLGDES